MGGIKVYEPLSISAGIYKNLEKIEGSISIPPQSLVRENQPLYHVMNQIIIRESQPRVRRSEKIVKRTADGEVIGKIISYHRVGGDFPTIIGHPTYYRCPDSKSIYREQSKFIIIEGDRQ